MTTAQPITVTKCTRLKIIIHGAVQGVGFRPFVHRLATELALAGGVNNSARGVQIEVEGPRDALERFSRRLVTEKPPRSFIQSCETAWLDAVGYHGFQIQPSDPAGEKTAIILPDSATCPDCLREIFDPANRRYHYPFTNCTHCGPRFSIIEALPYDRANTTMKSFVMCPACQAEYDNPLDRRFHAQPNACPLCGPQLQFWNRRGESLFGGDEALRAAAHSIRRGRIVAVKGVGGFHLMVDARNPEAVARLRERKQREEKPFALMFPTLASVQAACEVSVLEEFFLTSPEAPIVLLRRRTAPGKDASVEISPLVAPRNPELGVMLPANPLHHLLMAELGFPVVATSGNLTDEPICISSPEALARLGGIADVFLVHDRPIARHVDDSIVRVLLGRELVLRRARGYAPLPVKVSKSGLRGSSSEASRVVQPATPDSKPETILAVGAHLKNSVALAVGEQVFISQHLGDLETEQAHNAFLRAVADLPALYEARAEIIAADLHPDYLSTKFADELGRTTTPAAKPIGVQHHVAHVLACIAENEVPLPALGVAWDGTGYGPDGTIWGGEFFRVTDTGVTRVAHLRPFCLPGGDRAVQEPRRAALGLLYEIFGDAVFQRRELPAVAAFSDADAALLRTMLKRRLNAPLTSSMGRLFDGVAAILGLRQESHFEGQAAMELEHAIEADETTEAYRLLSEHGRDGLNQAPIVLDWLPMVEAILADIRHGVTTGVMAAKFHMALVRTIVGVANRLGEHRVVLSGGCFQNRWLTEQAVERLRFKGLQPYWHQRVPPNDGGIALGQVFAARRGLRLR